MSLCMFSLLGMPGTAGFIGKFLVFSAAVQQRARDRQHVAGRGWS